MCQRAPLVPRSRFCGECRAQRSRQLAARYRQGLNLAPGEASISRMHASCGLRDVGAYLNVTASRVQQIERVALIKLRRALLPFLQEHNPETATKWSGRETPAQKWLARTSVRKELSLAQSRIIAQLRQLADEYAADGQHEIAVELRAEADDLVRRIEQVLKTDTLRK